MTTFGLLRVALVFALSTSLRAADVTIFAAASLTEALKELAPVYEKQSGDKLIFNFGASSTLAVQIKEGAPADVFFSADEAKMDSLEKAGVLATGTRRSLLSNALVIVVAVEKGSVVTNAEDLAKLGIGRVALAEPSTVPAGVYAKAYLQQQKLWEAVGPKVIPTENVRSCLAAVESGNVDAGIVYKTDALISKKVRVAFEVPVAQGPKISYPLAVVKGSKHFEEAQKLTAFLSSPEALSVFSKHGFLVVK